MIVRSVHVSNCKNNKIDETELTFKRKFSKFKESGSVKMKLRLTQYIHICCYSIICEFIVYITDRKLDRTKDLLIKNDILYFRGFFYLE